MSHYKIQPSLRSRVGLRIVQAIGAAVVLLVVFGAGLLTCRTKVDPEKARGILEASGYADVQTNGWSWQCGDGDWSCTSFDATAPGGHRVRGAVGCGMLGCGKACTVRISP